MIAERLGMAFAIMTFIVLGVWFLGSTTTKDEFVRELLFGSITNTRYLSLFFVALIVIALFGLDNMFASWRTERAEMKRLASEKTRLQERLLGPLSHTHGIEEVAEVAE